MLQFAMMTTGALACVFTKPIGLPDCTDADRDAVAIERRDVVGKAGEARAVAVVNRHVFVHHVQDRGVGAITDPDGADVEGLAGILHSLPGDFALPDDLALGLPAD